MSLQIGAKEFQALSAPYPSLKEFTDENLSSFGPRAEVAERKQGVVDCSDGSVKGFAVGLERKMNHGGQMRDTEPRIAASNEFLYTHKPLCM